MKHIGKEIRDILKREGISLYQVAKDLGITWESLYRSLQDNANPRWKRIRQILDYLGYDVVLKSKRKGVKRNEKVKSGKHP